MPRGRWSCRSSYPSRSWFTAEPWVRMSQLGAARLWAVFSIEILLLAIIRAPLDFSFTGYAFADRGSFLLGCHLASQGRVPTVDFGYIYGLVALLVGQAWFHLFGLTPMAHEVAMLLCALAGAWGIARFAGAMRLGMAGILFLIAALPFAILPSYPSLVHALEAALLCNGLAEQAAGRRPRALALATAAVLVKPAMGYPYGFLLLTLIGLDVWRKSAPAKGRIGWRNPLLRSLVPAILTGLILGAVVTACYGVRPLLATVLPTSGREVYRTLNEGFFFGEGRSFWYEPSFGIRYYVFTVVGFWIAASLWLVLAGLRAGWRMVRAYRAERPFGGDEIIFTCCLLHALFVTSFFGGPSSWDYYSYVLVMGAAATSINGTGAARVVSILALLAIFGYLGHLKLAGRAWTNEARSSETLGLWASTAERRAWRQVARVTRGHDTLMLASDGCAALWLPQFERPSGAYLIPHETTGAEIAHTVGRLERARMVVAVTRPPFDAALDLFPEFRRLLAERRLVLKNDWFAVYGARKPR